MENKLFEAMVKAMEVKNEKELEYMVAKQEADRVQAAYRAYKGAEATKTATTSIYCGTEDNVEFFKSIIDALGLNVEYEVYDCDGELEIEIKEVN